LEAQQMMILSKLGDKRRTRRPASRRPKPNKLCWVEGPESQRLEARTLLTPGFTAVPIPLVGLVQPDGITTGPDGNLWFTETGADRIGRMTPAGVLTEFPLPAVTVPDEVFGSPPGPTAITTGPDGALWFTGIPGEVDRITTAGVVTEFAVPLVLPPAGSPAGTAGTPATLTAITAGPDGALWFTGVPGEVGLITTAGVVTEFAVPDIPPPAGSPSGTAGTPATLSAITEGPDGALWFTGVPGEVGRITTAGVVTEFAVPEVPPPAGSPAGTASTQATLSAITTGPDGALWFLGVPGEVGRITTAGVVSEFAVPAAPLPAGSPFETQGFAPVLNALAMGPDGNLWFASSASDGAGDAAIGRMTPNGQVTFFSVPRNFLTFGGLTTGPDGNLWFTERESGVTAGEQPAVGEITPSGVLTLHNIPVGTTLDPNRGVGVGAAASTIAPDGSLWFTENAAIGRMTPDGTIQQFPLSPSLAGESLGSITSGPGGAVWFIILANNLDLADFGSIGRITTDGAITTYPVPENATVGGITEGPGGGVWFTESFINPNTGKESESIGHITSGGVITSFAVPRRHADWTSASLELSAITTGPDGNIWFTGDFINKQSNERSLIGELTTRGHVRLFELPRSLSVGSTSYADNLPCSTDSLISGPDGKLWFTAMDNKDSGIARISTSGKLAPFIPADIYGDLNAGPDGRVWFYGSDQASPKGQLALATRSGIVVTRDLPRPSSYGYIAEDFYGLAVERDGSLALTNGSSSILQVSGQNGPAGGLDYRNRPKHAPDYVYDSSTENDQWTNVSGTAHPTFAGVANPGAELTLWVQKQGESQPVAIGHVHANRDDGSWTLKSQVRLSDGSYAVTASQKGDTEPPSMLYTLDADPSSVSSEPLVIQTSRATKARPGAMS
jgi:streptogramin lyase